MLSTYIDLALGLILLFLLLSLLVSGLNEAVVRMLSIRSKFLWAYLRDTLDGSDAQGKSWLPSRIREVFGSLPFLRDPRPAHDSRPAPSESPEMPAQEDKAQDAMTVLLYERVREIDHPKRGRTSIANLPPERFSVAMMEMAAREPGGVEGLLEKLKAMNSPLYGHLKGVWETAQRDLDRFRQGVEGWFDSEMQRLSMLYRRYVKWVVAALALAVTLLFTMDGLEYTKTLLRDNGFRASVTAVAAGAPGAYDELKERCAQAEPDAVHHRDAQPARPGHGARPGNRPHRHARPKATRDHLERRRLVGPAHHAEPLARLVLTYVALLFGAPFWWDLFRRLTGIRCRR